MYRDTVGTFEIAKVFGEHKMFTCMIYSLQNYLLLSIFHCLQKLGIHKHYTTEEWIDWSKKHPELLNYVAASSGTSDADFEKIKEIMAAVDVKFICLDVANGYSEHVSQL
jgi:GMP reductase